MHDLPSLLAHSAAAYPYRLDPESGCVELLHVDRDFFRQASFLDERALAGRRFGGWRLSIDEIDAALAGAVPDRPARWIFHLGHCGSTLISRTLDGLPDVLGLREPMPLLALASYATEIDTPLARLSRSDFEQQLALMRRLLTRGFADTDRCVIKTTSVCSALTDRLLLPDDRALLVSVTLPVYLATLLREPTLRADARRDALLRLARLFATLGDDGTRLYALSDAQVIALIWLVEQDRFAAYAAHPHYATRVIRVDFDAWLDNPLMQLSEIATHFALGHAPDQLATAIEQGGPNRYAKNPAHTYSREQRRDELAAASHRFADEIAAGRGYAQELLHRYSDRLNVPENEL